MKNPTFVICNSCKNNDGECCCQKGMSYALSLFEGTNINVTLFGIKYGGNFARGQALGSGILEVGSVTEDTVTFTEKIVKPNEIITNTTVISICQLFGAKVSLTEDQVLALKEELCGGEDSCCCNNDLYEELKKYEVIKDEVPVEVSIETADTTNNKQDFNVIKACNNIVLLKLKPKPTKKASSIILVDGNVEANIDGEQVILNNLTGKVSTINEEVFPVVEDEYVIVPLCVISSIYTSISESI